MIFTSNKGLDYERAIEIADGVYWIGYVAESSGLHCNPYLVVDGGEAVVIDGGSRPEFPTVMMKILQTGIEPSAIKALIYQHYDPDLCGSIPNYENIIAHQDLKVISDAQNNVFIRHYSVSSPLISTAKLGYEYRFASGRTLKFFNTPYAHSQGSFITFDPQTGVLFTSDIFGSLGSQWDLFLKLTPECRACEDYGKCREKTCPLPDFLNFHRTIMTSNRALGHALETICSIEFSLLAPQHGSIIAEPRDMITVIEKLKTLKDVGIDRVLGDAALPDTRQLDDKLRQLEDRVK